MISENINEISRLQNQFVIEFQDVSDTSMTRDNDNEISRWQNEKIRVKQD